MVEIVRADSLAQDESGLTTYDAVPYGSLAFAQTHPDRLATMARIFGLAPPDVARCRVLELGCASGGNLIPIAFNLPGSTCVGVDLSRRHVEDGRATIEALGMPNITIEHASILNVNRTWGEFDYIICHGVFSWVEAPVQDKIFEIVRDQLAPNGVAYISYNTYPGWHMREMVRHMMRYHARRFGAPTEQIGQARALLDFLAGSVSPESGPYGQLLSGELERLRQAPDSYLFHEHLEQTNSPVYFHQFIERAQQAGLQYLSESDFVAMLTNRFPPPVAQTVERISADILHVEQYLDFVRNRLFRQTLLCHRAVRPKRALQPSLLHGLLLACASPSDSSDIELPPGKPAIFRVGSRKVEIDAPWMKAALVCLREQWPKAIDVEHLCALALERAAPHFSGRTAEDTRTALLNDLFQCFIAGLIELSTVEPACTNAPSETPAANALAAYQAGSNEGVVSARHEMVTLDKFGREVLRLANGQRGHRELVEELLERVRSAVLTVKANNVPVTDSDELRRILAVALEHALVGLTRAALLVA